MKDDIWIVIPGIGNQQPGETMTNLARSLGSVTGNPQLLHSECSLDDSSGEEPMINTFEVPMATKKVGDRSLIFLELYWNDLSNVKSSLLGLARGVFGVILGLRHLIPAVELEKGVRWPAKITDLFFWLLRGPLLGGSAFVFTSWLMLVIIFAGFHGYLLLDENAPYKDPEVFLNDHVWWIWSLMAAAIAFILLFSPIKFRGQRMWNNWTVKCFVIVALLFTIYLPIGHAIDSSSFPDVVSIFITLLIQPLKVLWGVANIIILLSLLVTFFQIMKYKNAQHPYIKIPYLTAAISMAFWVGAIPILLIGCYTITPLHLRFTGMDKFVDNSLPTAGWIWMSLILMMVSGAMLWRARHRWFKNNHHSVGPANSPPRLIFNYSITCLIAGITLIVILVFAFTNISILEKTLLGTLLGGLTQNLNLVVIISVPVVLPLLAMARPGLRLGLDIILDIINYFRPEGSQVNRAVRLPYSKLNFQLRNRVQSRLANIIEMISLNFKSRKLVLVAHSQGTIFALDYLSDPTHRTLLESFDQVILVTMGSPYTHIYQHYFPKYFLDKKRDRNLREAISQGNWLNMYCTDDYIGTFVARYDTINEEVEKIFPVNIEIGEGGHTGYFHDTRVIKRLRKLMFADKIE